MARRLRNFNEWTGIFEKWKASGLGIGEFCKGEGLCESRFYDIRKKIETGVDRHSKKKKEAAKQVQFVPVEIKAAADSAPKKASGYLEIVTPSGHLVRIH
jgi:hypothetical protein